MRRPIIGSLWLLHTSSMRKKIGIKLMAERPAPKIMSFDKKRLIAVNMIMNFVNKIDQCELLISEINIVQDHKGSISYHLASQHFKYWKCYIISRVFVKNSSQKVKIIKVDFSCSLLCGLQKAAKNKVCAQSSCISEDQRSSQQNTCVSSLVKTIFMNVAMRHRS